MASGREEVAEQGEAGGEGGLIESEGPLRLNESDPALSLLEVFYAFNSFRAVAPPVLITMICAALAVVYVRDPVTGQVNGGVQSPYLVLNETAATTSGEAVGFAALNAIVIVGVICGVTFLLVLCFYLKLWCLIGTYIFLAITMILGVSTSISVLIGLQYYYVQVDMVTFVLVFANFALTGVLVLFSHEANFWGGDNYQPFPDYIGQVYLVIISVIVAYIVSTIFPFYTTWLLLVVLALYDLCAVLTPCGPLNLLLNVSEQQGENGPESSIPSALLYSAGVQHNIPAQLYGGGPQNSAGVQNQAPAQQGGGGYRPGRRRENAHSAGAAGAAGMFLFMAQGGETIREEDGNRAQQELEDLVREYEEYEQELQSYREREQERGRDRDGTQTEQGDYEWVLERNDIKLGLGDFIFYSVLAAVSATFGFTACLAVMCCILTGLAGTLILLAVFQRALPALPISIALGVSSYFLANIFVSPMADDLASSLLAI